MSETAPNTTTQTSDADLEAMVAASDTGGRSPSNPTLDSITATICVWVWRI